MDDKRIIDNIRDTFNSEVPDVLSKIKSDPNFRVPTKEKVFSIKNLFSKKLAITFFSIFAVAILFTVGFTRNSNVIASTVTLEMNPSITISLNRRDYVVNVTAANDDGVQVIDQDVKYKGLTIEKTLEIIVKKMNDLGYVVDDEDLNNIILVEVNSQSDKIRSRVQDKFKTRLNKELEKYNNYHWVLNEDDFQLTDEQIKLIREHDLLKRMSTTKLALIIRINTLDEDQAVTDLAEMKVRHLYDLYYSLEDPENLPEREKMPPPRR